MKMIAELWVFVHDKLQLHRLGNMGRSPGVRDNPRKTYSMHTMLTRLTVSSLRASSTAAQQGWSGNSFSSGAAP